MSARAPERAVSLAVLAVAAVALLAGFALKDQCTARAWERGFQYRRSCYNDVYALYFFRGLNEGKFPYLSGNGEDHGENDGDLEYPAGTGLYIGTVGKVVFTAPPPGETDAGQKARVARDAVEFFRGNAVGLALAGLAAVAFTAATASDPRRALYVAGAPSLVLYAFHNWDLLAVALMAAALYAYRRKADATTGVLLGLGAATKLFPGLLLPGLAYARFRERRRRSFPLRMVIGAAIGFAVLNLPIMIANFRGWLWPWRFQSTRFPNFETIWFSIFRHTANSGIKIPSGFWSDTYPTLTGYVSGALFVVGAALLLRAEARRERVRPYALSFGIILVFLLTAKVFSPQYALWVLPFFALVRLPWYSFVAFAVTEAAVWFAISWWFIAQDGFGGSPDLRFLWVELAVVARHAVLVWLLALTRTAEERIAPSPGTEPAAAALAA